MSAVSSVKKRYFFKLLSGIASLSSNLLIMLIVPRALGPARFGDYTFLYNFFSQAISFLETGSSIALYTKLSKHNYQQGVITFYLSVILLIVALLGTFVCVVHSLGFLNQVWPGQYPIFIWAGLCVAFLMWLNTLFLKISDSHALTVETSLIQIGYRLVMLIAIAIIFCFGWVDLSSYFIYQGVGALLFSVALIVYFIKKGVFTPLMFHFKHVKWRAEMKEFWHYCSPLYVYNIASLVASLSALWLLQHFSGSTQQGYYGFGMSIAAACFLFTSSFTAIFTREYAIAHRDNNLEEMRRLLKRYLPLFYGITALISVFIAVNAHDVIALVAGRRYQGGFWAIVLLSLYPIHQTYGQLVGSAYYASGKTRAYRNVGLVSLPFGTILGYFLLAPHQLFGLHLGALGAAINMVLLQFISVNVLTFFMVRSLGLHFRFFLYSQIALMLLLGGVGLLCTSFSYRIDSSLWHIIFSGVAYIVCIGMILWFMSQIFGLDRQVLTRVFRVRQTKK